MAAQAQKVDTAATRAYIQQYKDIAIEEMKRVGIPASITLAQAIHESGIGKSYLAQNTNNHFGIKCHENWTGKTFKYTDDAPDECFRVYDSPEDSYRDHSDFLANRPRYAGLFLFGKNDYKAWAYGLKKAGYATNPRYPEILIKTIEDFQLDLFDRGETPAYITANTSAPLAAKNENTTPAVEEKQAEPQNDAITPAPSPEVPKTDEQPRMDLLKQEIVDNREPSEQRIVRINHRKAIRLQGKESMGLIGSILKISNEDLLAFNDVQDSAAVKAGELLFLQRKKNRNWEGRYKVEAGDKMWHIAQEKGVQLASLLRRNKLQAGEEPAVGETIFLKGQAQVKPMLRKEESPTAQPEKPKVAVIDIEEPPAPEATKAPVFPAPVKKEEAASTPETPVQTPPAPTPAASVATPPPAPAASVREPKTVYPAVIDYSKLPKSENGWHTVVKGDTMYNICKRYNISTAQLMEWNNLSDQSVKLGQVLKIRP